MNCLLLAPRRYPFVNAIRSGLVQNGVEVTIVDYHDFFDNHTNKWVKRYAPLPRKIRKYWERPFDAKVYQNYLRLHQEIKPEIVFIYNDQRISPDVLSRMKEQSRIAFMLGDNPLYSGSRNYYNLRVLFEADYIISPSSYWKRQLERIGVPNIHFDSFGINSGIFHPIPAISDSQKNQYAHDLAYIGNSKKNNWGLQRLLFLNSFSGLDIKAYLTGEIDLWIKEFPQLNGKLAVHNQYDPSFNNVVYNCSKIAPIEQVPSLIGGIHVRVFDVLGAGTLPLLEYSNDVVELFKGIDIPVVNHYKESQEVAEFWLSNERKRKECIQLMRSRVNEKYAPPKVIQRMFKFLNI